MIKKFFHKALLLLLFLAPGLLMAQKQKDTGSVTINVDKKVDEFIQNRITTRENDSLTDGYRIQILSTDKRNTAKTEKERFQTLFPNCPSYLTFDSPNFKVRVGDFKTKIEAQALFFKLLNEFPTLFIVEDKINPPPLVPCE